MNDKNVNALRIGQYNIDTWNNVEKAFKDIFERQYYTNQGPLTNKLESKLKNIFGVKHVICMANETIALMIAAKALGLQGRVLCPAFAPAEIALSIMWAGLEVELCDIDPETYQMSIPHAKDIIKKKQVDAILCVHLWGYHPENEEIKKLARVNNLPLYCYASHSIGSYINKNISGTFGDLDIYSFHESEVINATEGGCVCTNDDYLSARLRNIRSSYGAGEAVSIPFTGNGRMSEAQAAIALLCIKNISKILKRNKESFKLYYELLKSTPGIKILVSDQENIGNQHHAILEINEKQYGLSLHELRELLHEKNAECKLFHSFNLFDSFPLREKISEYKEMGDKVSQLTAKLIELPLGQYISLDDVQNICKIINLKN